MPKKPVVASYVSDFLKPDMLHVYRQINGQKSVEPWVFTHKRQCEDQFPFPKKHLTVLPKPRLRWWRRFMHKHFKHTPWQLFRWELRHALLELTRSEARLLHIYFGHTAIHLRPLIKAFPHPVVVSFHGADAGVGMEKSAHHAAMREVFASATIIQARSESLVNDLIKLGCPQEKIRLQRTGIPLDEWPFVPRESPADGAWRLLQSCRFIGKKGLDTTLKAFAIIQQQHPKAQLVLAGDGPLRAELERLALDLGVASAVKFPGFLTQAQLREEVYRSHFFLHPSRTTGDGNREGIPNSMLEAMASGAAVIATRHGGIPEAVTHRESGLLVDENDYESLAKETLSLMNSPETAQSIAAQGRQSVERNFDRQQNIALLERTYLELMQR